jgi:lysozyme
MDFIDEFELIVKDLKRHEGTGPKKRGRFLPYKDSVGILTIGYGINLDEGLDQGEVESLLDNRVNLVMSRCRSKFAPWWYELDTVRQQVLINMVFNMGMPRVLKFKKMIKAFKKRDYPEAHKQMLDSKWARQVKGRAKELAKRVLTGER